LQARSSAKAFPARTADIRALRRPPKQVLLSTEGAATTVGAVHKIYCSRVPQGGRLLDCDGAPAKIMVSNHVPGHIGHYGRAKSYFCFCELLVSVTRQSAASEKDSTPATVSCELTAIISDPLHTRPARAVLLSQTKDSEKAANRESPVVPPASAGRRAAVEMDGSGRESTPEPCFLERVLK
jgi:hypothetical protein